MSKSEEMAGLAMDAPFDASDFRPPGPALRLLAKRLVVLGLCTLLLALGVALCWTDVKHFLHAYLVNFLFFLSLSLGALFFVLAHHLTRAGWSVVLRRLAEVMAAALPALFVLFLPIVILVLFGDSQLYQWNSRAVLESDELIRHKAPYLNGPRFALFCVFYFAVWSLLARYYWSRSLRHDETGDESLLRRMRKWSGPAIIAFGVTATFAAFDWLMSLDPHWYSTIYGVYFFSGCAAGFFAFLALAAMFLQREGYLVEAVTAEHYHDVGKLLFGFVFFWGYIAFSQYMLIWYANIPEETLWYAHRQTGPWKWVALLLLFGHFLLPFLGLMSRRAKRNKLILGGWSALVLAMHWIDLYWLVMPHFDLDRLPFGFVDVFCLIAFAALYLAMCLHIAAGRLLIPLRDPYLPESLAFENI